MSYIDKIKLEGETGAKLFVLPNGEKTKHFITLDVLIKQPGGSQSMMNPIMLLNTWI